MLEVSGVSNYGKTANVNFGRGIKKYDDIKEKKSDSQGVQKSDGDTKWTKEDKQNMKYVISKLGYDPFESVGLDDFDRKYCFNLLSGYFDTPGILEDGHKKQCVIEITMSYCQCRKITEELNLELSRSDSNEKKVSSLTSAVASNFRKVCSTKVSAHSVVAIIS